MVSLNSLFISIFFVAAGSSAAKASSVESPDWEARFREVKSYDGLAERIKEKDGSWKSANPKIVEILTALRPKILEASKKRGVDARAIVGAIITENSLNTSFVDDIQNYLAVLQVSRKITYRGRRMTVGLGQLNVDAALSAEKHVAKIEGRTPRTEEELWSALQDRELVPDLVAIVLKEAQDLYLEQGFDIRQNPGVLTTLYNLGQYESRAEKAKNSGVPVRVNYFGLFVEKNLSVIDRILAERTLTAQEASAGKEESPDVKREKQRIFASIDHFIGKGHLFFDSARRLTAQEKAIEACRYPTKASPCRAEKAYRPLPTLRFADSTEFIQGCYDKDLKRLPSKGPEVEETCRRMKANYFVEVLVSTGCYRDSPECFEKSTVSLRKRQVNLESRKPAAESPAGDSAEIVLFSRKKPGV